MKNFIILFLFTLILSGCAISRSLSGPGYNENIKQIKGEPNRTVIIAITNAILDRSKRGPFDSKTQSLFKNIDRYDGFIAGSIRLKILGKEVWTYTIWENESSLKKFIHSREHLDDMFSTDSAIEKMRSLSVQITAKEAPLTWDKIEKMIETKEMKSYKSLQDRL